MENLVLFLAVLSVGALIWAIWTNAILKKKKEENREIKKFVDQVCVYLSSLAKLTDGEEVDIQTLTFLGVNSSQIVKGREHFFNKLTGKVLRNSIKERLLDGRMMFIQKFLSVRYLYNHEAVIYKELMEFAVKVTIEKIEKDLNDKIGVKDNPLMDFLFENNKEEYHRLYQRAHEEKLM